MTEITKLKAMGQVSVYSLPSNMSYKKFKNLKNKDQYLYSRKKNKIMNDGVSVLIDHLLLTQTSGLTYIGVGTGNSTAVATQQDLDATIGSRIAIYDNYRLNNVGYWSAYFNKNDCAGTWAEAGIFTALTGNYMVARIVLDPTFVKSTSNTAVVTWSITITGA